MDIWRIPSGGGAIERLTNYHARVAYPAFLDERTLLYTAPRPDGSGSGLYAMDIDRRIPHAVSFGLEEYISVAASADGRRLVATVANPTSHLWSVPITDHVVDEGGVSRFSLPAVRAAAPRFGPDSALLPVVQGGRRRALEIQGRRGDRALARQRGDGGRRAGDLTRRQPDLLRGSARRTRPSLCHGGGWHRLSPHRGVARRPRCPVLVSRWKVDRRHRFRRQRATAVQGPASTAESRCGSSAGSIPTRSGRPMADSSSIPRIRRRVGVPPESGHSGKAAVPAADVRALMAGEADLLGWFGRHWGQPPRPASSAPRSRSVSEETAIASCRGATSLVLMLGGLPTA